MTAERLTEHPLYLAAGSQIQRLWGKLREVPPIRWRQLCILLLVLWICHSIADLFWLVIPEPSLPEPPLVAQPSVENTVSGGTSVDIASLQALKLFGDAAEAEVQPTEEVKPQGIEEEAVDTRLSLKLQGIVASNDERDGWAIIADGSQQDLYKVGDELPQGNKVTLAKVLDLRVILDNNGRYESLWLYSGDDSAPVSPKRSSRVSSKRPVAQRAAAKKPGGVRQVNTRVSQLPRSIGDVVRFTVARENGKMVGYKIRPGRDRELFEQLGLQTNDVVTAVNGIEINDPRKVKEVYQSLRTATEAQLELTRNGDPMSINVSLDEGEVN